MIAKTMCRRCSPNPFGLLIVAMFMVVVSGSVLSEDRTEDARYRTAARAIDGHIRDTWTREKIEPALEADDAEFLRRLYLDVAGRIPSASTVRAFLADESADKRQRVVDDLLDSPTYITNFTTVWRNALLPEAAADFQLRTLVPSFEAWLRQKLADDVPYDQFVRELITSPIPTGGNRNPLPGAGRPTAFAFFQAKQAKPENLASSTAQLFLGVRIGCAQCHHHPFDEWKQEQFWSYASFFASLDRNADQGIFSPIQEVISRRELTIPDTDDVVQASFLDGSEPKWERLTNPRVALADWITAPDNPWFARMAVNRMWGHFFGRGFVDPVDDFSSENPPSHPELLDELAQEFVHSGFDLKFLIRAITATDVYQRTSRQTHESQSEPSLFARMPVKGLTPEQLFDSLAEATGFYQPFRSQNPFVLQMNSPRSEFLNLFRNDNDAPVERETTILQALSMMNGSFVADATSLGRSQTLTAIVEFPLMDDRERIDALYIAVLSRPPREAETKRLLEYLEKGGTTGDSRVALSDIMWALLNSSEFLFNH